MDVKPLKKLSWKRFFFIRFWVISVPLTRIWFLKATYFKFTLWISKLIKNLSSKDCCNEDLWEWVLSITLLRSRIHLKDVFSLCFAQYVPLWLKFYLFFVTHLVLLVFWLSGSLPLKNLLQLETRTWKMNSSEVAREGEF